MTEKAFEKKCIEQLRKLPRSYWPDKEAIATVPGLADRTGCINGRYIALEFKRDMHSALAKTKTTVRQKYAMDKVEFAGGFGVFCYPQNWNMVYRQLKEMSRVK